MLSQLGVLCLLDSLVSFYKGELFLLLRRKEVQLEMPITLGSLQVRRNLSEQAVVVVVGGWIGGISPPLTQRGVVHLVEDFVRPVGQSRDAQDQVLLIWEVAFF